MRQIKDAGPTSGDDARGSRQKGAAMRHDPLAAWGVDEADWPREGSAEEKLRFLVRWAILAPSGHNTQPWAFRVQGGRLEVIADRLRALPVVDPHDRALVISCGAAVATARAALHGLGHAADVALLPEAGEPDLMARIGLGAERAPDEADRARLGAIVRRRTTRRAFAGEPVPEGLARRIAAAAEAAGAEAVLVTAAEGKAALAELVAEGDRAQFADPAFRRELGAWVHPRRTGDGISGANFGMPDTLSAVGGLVIRTFDMGGGIAAKDEEIATASPALLVVATEGDGPRDWLAAGIGHADMLLEVTAAGWTAAYLNQPVEVERLRPVLRARSGCRGVPQLLMRIGRGPQIAPAARRPVEEVLAR
jgi:nitroreductase